MYPGHIAHHSLRSHGAKGNNLRYRIATIVIRDITNHTIAVLHTKIDIEVGHGHPLGIEEALEQQIVLQGVQVSDIERISHQGAGTRTATGPDRNVVILGPFDKVHHDEEVTRKAHLGNNVQLKTQAILILFATLSIVGGVLIKNGGQALVQAIKTDLGKKLCFSHTLGDGKFRQVVLAQPNLKAATLGNFKGVFQRFGNIGKQGRHFLGAA